MARYDGSIRINTRINTDGIRQGESDIRGSMNRISGSAKKLYATLATVFAVGKIAQFGKEALQAASDFEAMEAQFSQVFGNLEENASQSLSAVANQAGIAEERMKNSFTKIAAFAKTTGMDTASSLKLSERAMVAVADSAAFYDRSLEETTEYLQSFLKGNYENDAALGLSATEYTRNSAAMKLYGKSFIELSEAQKQLTLLQMVEDANRLSGAMGQAAREADTWTNQVGNLKQAWTTLMASIGKIILPAAIQAVKFITNVINSLNAMIARLSVAAGAFRSFSELLTGKKSSAGSGAGNVASSGGISEDTADGYNAAADAAENLAGSTKKAAKATKDAKKAAEGYLNPLDEINKINEKESTSGSGGGGEAPGIGGAVENVDYGNLAEGETVVDKLDEKLLALKEILSGLIRPFKEAWDSEGAATIEAARFALSSLGELAKSVAKSFYEVWTNGTGTQTLTLILQIAQNVLMTIGNIADRLNVAWNTNSVGTSIIQNIFNIYNTILGTIERITGATAEWASKLDFYPLLESINGLLESVQPLTQNIGDGLAWFYENVLLPIAGWTIQEAIPVFLDMLSAAIGALNKVIEALKPLGIWLWENFLQPLGQWAGDAIIGAMKTITDLLTKFGDWVSDHQVAVQNMTIVIGSFFAAFKISSIISKAIALIQGLGLALTGGGGLASVLSAIVSFLGGPVTLAITAIIAAGVLLWKNWDTIKEKAGELKDWLVEKWESIAEAAKGLIPGIMQGIKDGWDSFINWLGDLWDEIVEGFKSFFGIHSPSTVMAEMGKYIIEGLRKGISDVFGGFLQFWDTKKKDIINKFNDIKEKFIEKGRSVISGIKDGISNAWSGFYSYWGERKNLIVNKFNDVKEKFLKRGNEIVSGIRNGISNSWSTFSSYIKNKKESIVNTFSGIGRSMRNVGRDIVNGIIDGIRSGWNALKSWASSIVDMFSINVSGSGGGTRAVSGSSRTYSRSYSPYIENPAFATMQSARIPRLATGTVIPPNREFMAVLGDNKREPEVVSPLSTIEQAMENVMARHGGSGSGGNGNVTLQVILDRKVLAESTLTWGEIQQMSTGKNPFMLGTT